MSKDRKQTVNMLSTAEGRDLDVKIALIRYVIFPVKACQLLIYTPSKSYTILAHTKVASTNIYLTFTFNVLGLAYKLRPYCGVCFGSLKEPLLLFAKFYLYFILYFQLYVTY